MADDDLIFPVVCDCGTEFGVPVGWTNNDAVEAVCPACAATDTIGSDQIASLRDQVKAIGAIGLEQVRKATQDMLAGVAARTKGVTYRRN